MTESGADAFQRSQRENDRCILLRMRSLLPKSLALLIAAAFLFPACRKRDTAAGGDEFLRLSNVGQAHPTFAQLSFPPPEFSLAA